MDSAGWNGWQQDIEDFVDNGVRWTGRGRECMLEVEDDVKKLRLSL